MREKQSSYQVTSAHGSGEHPPAGKQADRSGSRQKARCDMGQTRPGQGTPISMSGVIRIWRQAWEEFTPFLKVPAGASQGRVHHACLNGGCGSAGGDDSCTPCPTCFGVVALLVSVSPPVARSVLSLDRSVTCVCPPWWGVLFRRMDALRRAFCRSRKHPQSIRG